MNALAAWFDGLPIGAQITIAMSISFVMGWGFGFVTGRDRYRSIKGDDR